MSSTSPPVITFDFHNTLIRCDRWFQLEVHDLIPAYLGWLADSRGDEPPAASQMVDAKALYAALRREVATTGIELSAAAGVARILPRIGVAASTAEIDAGVDALMRATFDDDVQPMPGAVETVRYLAGQGVTLGVISIAIHTPFLHWSLARFGMDDAFRAVVTSADAGYTKSHPELFRSVAARLGADPTAIVHVGDSARFDVGGAARAGFGTVWVRGEREPDPDYVADLTLPSLVGAGPALLRLATTRAECSRRQPTNHDHDG